MTVYRILDPNQDYNILSDLLTDYLNDQKSQPKTVYPIEASEYMIKRYLEIFTESVNFPPNNYIVSGAFEDDELVGVAIGRKINNAWNIPHVVLPTWILLFAHYKTKEMKSPKYKLHNLINPIITIMENDKFYNWFKVSKFSNKVTPENVEDYLNKVYSKTINAERYFVTIEAVIETQNERDSLPSAFRGMFPPIVHDGVRLVLMQHHYKNSLRKF